MMDTSFTCNQNGPCSYHIFEQFNNNFKGQVTSALLAYSYKTPSKPDLCFTNIIVSVIGEHVQLHSRLVLQCTHTTKFNNNVLIYKRNIIIQFHSIFLSHYFLSCVKDTMMTKRLCPRDRRRTCFLHYWYFFSFSFCTLFVCANL